MMILEGDNDNGDDVGDNDGGDDGWGKKGYNDQGWKKCRTMGPLVPGKN